MKLSEGKVTIVKVDNGFVLQYVEIVGKAVDPQGNEVNRGELRQRVVQGDFDDMYDALRKVFTDGNIHPVM